jgi:hypothetical protein
MAELKKGRGGSAASKAGAKKRATSRAQARSRRSEAYKALYGKPKVVEAGVGNLPMTIARGVGALASRASAARGAARGTSARASATKSKPKPKVPLKTLQSYKASPKPPSRLSSLSKGKKIGYGTLAAAGVTGAAASRLEVSVKPPVKPKSGSGPKKGDTKMLGGRKAVYNGTNWVPAKK